MNSIRSYSTATAADADADSSWTRVTSGGRRSTAWGTPSLLGPPSKLGGSDAALRVGGGERGTPTVTATSSTAARRPFSFASTETAAALDPTTAAPAKKGNNWASSRPGGAVSAAKAAIPRPLDIRSMSDFPTLGGGSIPVARSSATATSWSSTVAGRAEEKPTTTSEAAPTDEVDATLSFLRNRRQPSATVTIAAAPSRTSRLAAIGTRCFDDGPTDYDGPEEDDDGAGSYHVPEEGESETMGELNAELAVTRRAGDKSDW